MGKGPQKKINQRCSGKSREAACDAPLLNGNESVRRPTKLNVQAKEFKPQVYTHGPANFRDCLPFGGLPIPAPVPIATSLLPAVVTAPVPLQQISPDYPNVGPSSSLDVPPENPCFPVLRPAPPLPVPVAPMVNGQSPATANVQNGAMQMQIPDVNPVVYPDRYGRPGTAFYMPWAYVPDTAIPLPECDQNGVIHTVYYVQVQRY